MSQRTDRFSCGAGRLALLLGVMQLPLLASSGCGILPFPTDVLSLVQGSQEPTDSRIEASVTAAAPETGMPTTLSGSVSGEFEGTYEEEILEVFFDGAGVPIAALSRSQFAIDAPDEGTLISLNLIVVVDTILLTDEAGTPVLDEQGGPIVSGLQTSAAGQIIHGAGAFEGATGELHTESVLTFLGGDFGLGAVESDLFVTLQAEGTD
jgi:hypothetical protein